MGQRVPFPPGLDEDEFRRAVEETWRQMRVQSMMVGAAICSAIILGVVVWFVWFLRAGGLP